MSNDPVYDETVMDIQSNTLIKRLQKAEQDDHDPVLNGALYKEARKEIVRLRKIVDALTVRLNKELTATDGLEERLTNAEHRMTALFNQLQALRTGRI